MTLPALPGSEVEYELGSGGMGTTYAARRVSDGIRVAVKTLDLSKAEDWKSVELFEREAEVLRGIDLPGVPSYIDSFTIGESGYALVQELAGGTPMHELAAQQAMSIAAVRDVAEQVLAILIGLQKMRPPIVHRDIKPANLVMSDDGTIRLVDFGAVKAAWDEAIGGGSTVVGTFGYMAPEQFRGSASLATDLYGLGATLLHLLTARDPSDFEVEQLRIQFRDVVNLPEELTDWLERMLEPHEEYRFQSAEEALSALRKPPAETSLEPLPGRSRVEVEHGPGTAAMTVRAPWFKNKLAGSALLFGAAWTSICALIGAASLAGGSGGVAAGSFFMASLGVWVSMATLDAMSARYQATFDSERWSFMRRSLIRRSEVEGPIDDFLRASKRDTGTRVGGRVIHEVSLETKSDSQAMRAGLSDFELKWVSDWLNEQSARVGRGEQVQLTPPAAHAAEETTEQSEKTILESATVETHR
ncbi:MAG: hypothetical protein ACJAYU_003480 [Bradymonadia bacterium]|jgi:hypothetical protein